MSQFLNLIQIPDLAFRNVLKQTQSYILKKRKGSNIIYQPLDNSVIPLEVFSNMKGPIIVMKNLDKLRDFVEKNDVRLLFGAMLNSEEISEFLEWIKNFHPDIPIMVTVEDEEQKEIIEKDFPDVEILTNKIEKKEENTVQEKNNYSILKIKDKNYCHHCTMTTSHSVSGKAYICSRCGALKTKNRMPVANLFPSTFMN